jgi:YD repeat-containing protein
MSVQSEEIQPRTSNENSCVTEPALASKRSHSAFQVSVPIGTILAVSLMLFLGLHLFTAHKPVPPHRYVEAGVSASDLAARPSGKPLEVEAKSSDLVGNGRIYLVQLGDKRMPYSLGALAGWLRSSYSLEVEILPALPLGQAAYDSSRNQYVSQLLNDQIRRNLAVLNADPSATIIGVTDADMYSIAKEWDSSFTQRDSAHRIAILSADCFSERTVSWLKSKPGAYAGALESALERILLRDVAILYWHLPLNNNSGSVLAPLLDVTLPGHALYQSELHPERTQWGMYITDPCLTFSYKRGSPGAPATVEPADVDFLGECAPLEERSHNEQEERFQIQLAYGLLTVRHTDFYQPGVIPIEFERATSDWWKNGSRAFGRSGSHNYDQYLSTQDDMRHIEVASTAGDSEPLVRVPEWIPILLFNRWVDQYGSGKMARLRWHPGPPEHFDLTRYTGDVESYLPCDDKRTCYMNGLHNAHGDILRFDRDSDRSLIRLTGPDEHWLAFSYGEGKRVSSIVDNRGRQVMYHYDERGYLTGVNYPSGERLEYGYDDQGYMVTFSAAPDAAEPLRLMLRNEYERGRLSRQTLADGRVFEYRYKARASSEPALAASVIRPDGTILDFTMSSGAGSTVHERYNR